MEAALTEPRPRFDRGLAFVVALAGAAFAASGLREATRPSHDAAAVRTLSAGYTGLLRSLDAVLAALTTLVPIGSRAERVAVAGVFATFGVGLVASHLLFALRRRLGSVSRVGAVASSLGVLAALLGPAWDAESHVTGGAALGALLTLLPLAFTVSSNGAPPSRANTLRAALFASLALSYEPLVGVAAILGAAPLVRKETFGGKTRLGMTIAALIALAIGALPLAAAALRLGARPGSLLALPFEAWLGEGPLEPRSPARTVAALLGYGMPVVAIGAVGWCARATAAPARRIVLGLTGIALTGGAAILLDAPQGPTRVVAPILAAILALAILAGSIIAVAIDAVARAPIPLAGTSAALLVLLGASYPARFLDDAVTARGTRAGDAADAWNDAAFAAVPDRAVVLVGSAALWTHLMAERAKGALRSDLLLVPYFAVGSAPMARAIGAEPALVPVYRDFVLRGAPSELALSKLTEARPVVCDLGAKWDRTLARHVVPVGMLLRFYAEPHGQAERLRAMDEWRAARERLAVRVADRQHDVVLRRLTIALTRRRALAMAQSNDRESATRALDDLRAFDGDDAFATKLTRRLVGARGNIDSSDLVP